MIACPVAADSNFNRFPIAYFFVPCPKKHENGLKDLASDLVSNLFAVARSLLSRVDGPLDTRGYFGVSTDCLKMASKMDIDEKLNSSLDTLVKQSGDRPSRGGGSGRGRGRGEKRERNDTGELWWLSSIKNEVSPYASLQGET